MCIEKAFVIFVWAWIFVGVESFLTFFLCCFALMAKSF